MDGSSAQCFNVRAAQHVVLSNMHTVWSWGGLWRRIALTAVLQSGRSTLEDVSQGTWRDGKFGLVQPVAAAGPSQCQVP
jgi:hypothetical protein